METSVFLAKSLAVFFGTVGIGFLFYTEHYKKMLEDLLNSPSGMFIMGILALAFGGIILFSQSILVNDWTAILGFVGWASVIKGSVFLIFPKFPAIFTPLISSPKLNRFYGILILCIAAVFVYFGFCL